jgi:CheY-like chemotaxis protein
LIVEDDGLVRAVAVDALVDAGFDVVEADTGEEALAECEAQVLDALFTDIKLPGQVTGWDIAEKCREADPNLPVIYATGFSPVVARPVPGSIIFQKPYTPEQLISGGAEYSYALRCLTTGVMRDRVATLVNCGHECSERAILLMTQAV